LPKQAVFFVLADRGFKVLDSHAELAD